MSHRCGVVLLLCSLTHTLTAASADQVHKRFQFAPGKTAEGFTLVAVDAVYTKQRGFGFEESAGIRIFDRGDDNPLHAGFCTSEKPFFFSIDLPEGNYRVTVTLGDKEGESTTTVKSELRRLMLEHVHTAAGEFVTRSFIVNIRTPKIGTGGQVSLKAPRETVEGAWNWDSRLTLEFNDKRPCLCALEIEKVQVPTIYILGDSTVCDQPKEPYGSWGQMLPRFFKPNIAVANHAESGETLRSSTSAHRLEKVLADLKPGDYVLIQFGHNDMKSKLPDAPQVYQATLKHWVQLIKQKNGIPVLITSMNRHRFEGNTVVNSLAQYPEMVRQAAADEKVALIDLNVMSKSLYEAFGPVAAVQLFKHNSPDDKKFDGTHHSPYGAYELAKCVIEGLKSARPELAPHVAEDVDTFDPSKPDAADHFLVPPSPGYTNQRPLGD